MVKNSEPAKLSDYQHAEMLIQIMREIWDKAKSLIANMDTHTQFLVEKTNLYICQMSRRNAKSTAKDKKCFIDLIESINHYSVLIYKYHDLLNSHECSYQVPLAFYKKLRHELVVQVVIDIRRITMLIDAMSAMATCDFVFKRWRYELMRFAVLDFELQRH